MPWGYIIHWSEYHIPGVNVLEDVCIAAPICEVCEDEPFEPNPEECSPNLELTVPDCTITFDPACMPIWWIDEIIAELTPLCNAIFAQFPDICDSTLGQPIPGFIPFGACCTLDCLEYISSKREGDCVTEEDLPPETPEDFPGEAGPDRDNAWDRCREALLRLLRIWETRGDDIVAARCLDADFPIFGTIDTVVHYKSIRLPAGSRLVDSGCQTITVDDGCAQCPPAE